jgi:hypothetical protein
MHMSRNNQELAGKPPLSHEMLEKLIVKGLVLFLMAVVVYLPVRSGGYIYDDDTLCYNNAAIRRGYGDPRGTLPNGKPVQNPGWNAESWAGLWSLWYPVGPYAAVSADYAPLSSTTLWLEFRFWGNNGDVAGPELNPLVVGLGSPGYHITNIVLHGIHGSPPWHGRCILSARNPWPGSPSGETPSP